MLEVVEGGKREHHDDARNGQALHDSSGCAQSDVARNSEPEGSSATIDSWKMCAPVPSSGSGGRSVAEQEHVEAMR